MKAKPALGRLEGALRELFKKHLDLDLKVRDLQRRNQKSKESENETWVGKPATYARSRPKRDD